MIGVFEGMRVYGGKTFRLRQHVDRLYDSAKAILLEVPISRDEMIGGDRRRRAPVGTQGSVPAPCGHPRRRATWGLDPRKCPRASVVIIFDTISLWPPERYEAGPLGHHRWAPRFPIASRCRRGSSRSNYLCHILAKVEGTNANADEVIMLDSAGHVAEASGMNPLRGEG